MAANRGRRWPGGYVRKRGDGVRVYIIRKVHDGKRYEVSTHATTEAQAKVELGYFEQDREHYRPGVDPNTPDALCLFDERLEPDDDRQIGRVYLKHCEAPKEKGGRGQCEAWLAETDRLLVWWGKKLAGVDLRRLSMTKVAELLPTGSPAYRTKLAVFKAFVSWLRETERLRDGQGPATHRMKLPKIRVDHGDPQRAAKGTRALRGYLVVRELLGPRAAHFRDGLDVLAGTGWHRSELLRWLSQSAVVEPCPEGRESEGAAVLVTKHKSGDWHRTIVTDAVLEAARRLRERWVGGEGFDLRTFTDSVHHAIEIACEKARESSDREHDGCAKNGRCLHRWGPGHLRHAVATWAHRRKLDAPEIALGLGHRGADAAITRRHYIDSYVPPKLPTPI